MLRRTGMQNGKKVKKGIKSGEYELDLQNQIFAEGWCPDRSYKDRISDSVQPSCKRTESCCEGVPVGHESGISMKIISMTIPCLYI